MTGEDMTKTMLPVTTKNIKHRHIKHKKYAIQGFHSIRTKLILIMILMMGLTLLVFSFLNYTLLSPFYAYSKASQLEHSYQEVSGILENDKEYTKNGDELDSDSQLDLEIIGQNSSVTIYVFRVTNFWGVTNYTFDYPRVSDMQKRIIEDLTQNYIYGVDGTDGHGQMGGQGRKLIRQKKAYNIYKVYDQHMGSHYMELFGQTQSGAFVYLRTNYQSMNENIDIFNHFIAYAGVGVMILGAILMIFVGNSFAKPILQITEIAKKMSELDFNVKYPVKTQDEIGVLGNSINMLSEKLEGTISELKTANNELQQDIEKKTQIDEMRKEFLSNVSHELKTPIALIQGYAEGLQDNINDDEESRNFYCEVIIDEANKMNKMVKKLLTLNQIEFGNNQVTFERFDIVGKQLLKSNRKLYIVDLGLRNYILPRQNYDLGFSLENIVYFELLRRGYRVMIGKVGNTEVDFVAERKGTYSYIQVTADMTAKETFERELKPLSNIRDNYEKIVLTADRFTPGNYNGIQVKYLPDWLLGKNS